MENNGIKNAMSATLGKRLAPDPVKLSEAVSFQLQGSFGDTLAALTSAPLAQQPENRSPEQVPHKRSKDLTERPAVAANQRTQDRPGASGDLSSARDDERAPAGATKNRAADRQAPGEAEGTGKDGEQTLAQAEAGDAATGKKTSSAESDDDTQPLAEEGADAGEDLAGIVVPDEEKSMEAASGVVNPVVAPTQGGSDTASKTGDGAGTAARGENSRQMLEASPITDAVTEDERAATSARGRADAEAVLDGESDQPLEDSAKGKKTDRLQVTLEGTQPTVRALEEALRQQGEGALNQEGSPRGREQALAQALGQAISASGGGRGTSDQATMQPLAGVTQAQTPGAQKLSGEVKPVVTRLNTPFQQPAWTEMMQGRVAWMVRSEIKMATIYIDPPELGPVHITIQQNGDQTQVNFQVQNQSVRESLEQSAHRLRDNLADQGFTQVDVNVRGGKEERQEHGAQDDSGSAHPQAGQSAGAEAGEADAQDGTLAENTGAGLINTYA